MPDVRSQKDIFYLVLGHCKDPYNTLHVEWFFIITFNKQLCITYSQVLRFNMFRYFSNLRITLLNINLLANHSLWYYKILDFKIREEDRKIFSYTIILQRFKNKYYIPAPIYTYMYETIFSCLQQLCMKSVTIIAIYETIISYLLPLPLIPKIK